MPQSQPSMLPPAGEYFSCLHQSQRDHKCTIDCDLQSWGVAVPVIVLSFISIACVGVGSLRYNSNGAIDALEARLPVIGWSNEAKCCNLIDVYDVLEQPTMVGALQNDISYAYVHTKKCMHSMQCDG